jgi:hypothetical protein
VITALLFAALLQAAPAAPDDAEILVVGHKLAAITVSVGRDAKGKLGCSLSASSGHARLDEQLCRTASACVRKGTSDVKACVDQRKPALLEDFRRSYRGGAR